MKKILIIITAVAIVSFSCSKQETHNTPKNNEVIGFGSQVQKPTKGTGISTIGGTSSMALTEFGVLGYYNLGGIADYSTMKPDFLYNAKIIKENGIFTYANAEDKRYWPNNEADLIDFYAYSPYKTETNGVVLIPSDDQTAGYPKLGFTVNSDIKLQDDLIVSKALGTSKMADQGLTNGDVKFEFGHALTKIGFTISKKDIYPNTTIKVTDLIIKNIDDEGDFLFEEYPAIADPSEWWTLKGNKKDFTIITGGNYELAWDNGTNRAIRIDPLHDLTNIDMPDQFNNCMFMIPQTVNGLELEVKTVVNSGGKNINNNCIIKLDDSESWAPGKFITYNIIVALHEITFSASVNNWEEKPVETPINSNISVTYNDEASLSELFKNMNVLPSAVNSLTINGRKSLTVADFSYLKLNFKNLSVLKIMGGSRIADYSTASFPVNITSLELDNVSAYSFSTFANMNKLSTLTISGVNSKIDFSTITLSKPELLLYLELDKIDALASDTFTPFSNLTILKLAKTASINTIPTLNIPVSANINLYLGTDSNEFNNYITNNNSFGSITNWKSVSSF